MSFRENKAFHITINTKRLTPYRVIDRYMLAFLWGVDYSENCYDCKYATKKRCADITLGDAWGQLSETEADGASLILCQSKKGLELVNESKIYLYDVDISKAVDSNSQLRGPSRKHRGRKRFFYLINHNAKFDIAVLFAMPKECIKEKVKEWLIKFHIISDYS